MFRLENKEFYVDLKENKYGLFVKISEKSKSSRSTVLIPVAGIPELTAALNQAAIMGKKIELERLDLVI